MMQVLSSELATAQGGIDRMPVVEIISSNRDGSDSFDLTAFLVAASEVSIKRSIDGSLNELEFEVSHGHLFDPNNEASEWVSVLRAFRKVTVRFGENINGVDYFHPAGIFVITGARMSYGRGDYPTISVTAEDRRFSWGDKGIVATDYYEDTPENILADILETFADLDAGDIDIPSFAGSYQIWFQWLDTKVKKIVETLCGRFGYFPSITVDDTFSARPISNTNPIDHTYPDTTMIISYTPNDEFSDFTNRVAVTGEGREFIEALAAEEALTAIQGTSGWWAQGFLLSVDFQEDHFVWYSDDHLKKYRYPRLEVLISVKSGHFGFIREGQFNITGWLDRYVLYMIGLSDADADRITAFNDGRQGSIAMNSEGISFIDPNETYCIVSLVLPNLVPLALTSLGIVLWWAYRMRGTAMIPGESFMIWVLLLAVFSYIITSFTQWSYQVHARPIVSMRRGVSGQADDLALQTLLGRISLKKLDEPLCVTNDQCQWLAEHELMIAQLQRRRIQFDKTAHLQDEEGDTIQIPHPFTGEQMTVFVTDLKRKFRVPDKVGDDGGFIDSIEGWKL